MLDSQPKAKPIVLDIAVFRLNKSEDTFGRELPSTSLHRPGRPELMLSTEFSSGTLNWVFWNTG